MGWFGRLLGRSDAEVDTGGKFELEPLVQGGGAHIAAKLRTITHGFIVLTHADTHHWGRASELIGSLNHHSQPRAWSESKRAELVTLSADVSANGFPGVELIGLGLENAGLKRPYSLIVNTMTVTFDGGVSQSKVLVGFSFRERQTRLILPRTDGCG